MRAAVHLAASALDGRPQDWVTADEIAEAQGVPPAFLLNILKVLRTAGLVEAKRGATGGYRLARPPAEITVGDVVRATDGPLASVAGHLVEDLAYPGAAAGLRETWVALRCAIRSVLVTVTLADVVTGALPPHVQALLADDDSFRTDPEVRRRFEARSHDPA